MIDLHTHTHYSDGTDSVIDLLKKAEEVGLEYLSITDHGTCEAYEELEKIEITKYYKGKIVTGCELFTTINGATVELLGYDIDTKMVIEELPKLYQYSLNDIGRFEMKKAIEKYKNMGIKMAEEEINLNSIFASKEMHKVIIKYPENRKFFDSENTWEDSYTFYRECMSNPNSKFFINKSEIFPSIKEVIDLIKRAGGLVFIPHIYVYGENAIPFLNELVQNYDIDGIECYYSLFTKQQNEFLLKYCKQNKLYISGGSDYHGLRKADISLGTGRNNLNIPKEILKDWINK